MSSQSWLVVAFAGTSAGAYAGNLAAVFFGRRRITGLPFPEIVTGGVFFAAQRGFPNVEPLTILAALFLTMACVQIVRARETAADARILAFVPLAAMLLICIQQICPPQTAPRLEDAVAILLCAPAPAAAVFGLRNLYLVREVAFDRVR